MPDKLTDKEIKKALECWSKVACEENCEKCSIGENNCLQLNLEEISLDLINRLQKADEKNKDSIRLLQLAIDQKRRKIVRLEEDNQELQEEVKNLEADNERLFRDNQKVLSNWLWGNKKHKTDYLKQLKAEAYKEFAELVLEDIYEDNELYEKCVKGLCSKEYQQGYAEKNDSIVQHIKNRLKELVGDKDG